MGKSAMRSNDVAALAMRIGAFILEFSQRGAARYQRTNGGNDLVAQNLRLDAIYGLGCKSVGQHIARVGFVQPARTQVEHAVVIQLTHGRAVRALDVVGVNLQFGACIGLGQTRQQQTSSEERRVGKESVSTCRTRWSP